MVFQKIVSDPVMVEDGSRSACGEYPHCWSCRSFLLTLETWHTRSGAPDAMPTNILVASLLIVSWNLLPRALPGEKRQRTPGHSLLMLCINSPCTPGHSLLMPFPRLAGVTSPRQRWFEPGRAGENAMVVTTDVKLPQNRRSKIPHP